MKFGLSEKDISYIKGVVSTFPEIDKVIIFGSRAMGNYKNGSDIDLAIHGTNITSRLIHELHSNLEEDIPLPYFFDVLNYETLGNDNLKSHISKVGKRFY